MSTNINLQLPKEHILQIREYYKNRLTQLQNEITEISDLLRQLDAPLPESAKTFNGQGILLQTPVQALPNGYHPQWSLIRKAKFVLKQAGRSLTTKTIVDFIIENYEGSLRNDRKRFYASMSGVLSANSTKPDAIFKRHQNDLEEWEYEVK